MALQLQKNVKEVFYLEMFLGVNSKIPLNKKLKNGYTMFDWFSRQKGFPAFCMRTLTGENKITFEEIEFLHKKGCKIGFVDRKLTERAVSGINGTEEALRAVKAAEKIGIPKNYGIAIFAEIAPDWSINHNWMISYAQVIFANGYIPGFIGNTDSSKNFNFDRQCSHYVQATRDMNCFEAVYAATEPKTDVFPEVWAPYCPSALNPEDISLWVCGVTEFDSLTVEDVYSKNYKTLVNMW